MNGYRKRWRSKIDVMLLLLGDLIGPPLLALLMRSCDVGFELPLALALDYLIEKMTWRFRYSVMRWRLVPVVPHGGCPFSCWPHRWKEVRSKCKV